MEDRRYTISEASELTGVSPHVLRQWEKKIAKLRPKRSRTGRRQYEPKDVEIIRTVKYFLRHKGMKLAAVNRLINQGGYVGMIPKSPDAARALIGRIKTEVAAMLDMIESMDHAERRDP